MLWIVLYLVVFSLGLSAWALKLRRRELATLSDVLAERRKAIARRTHDARLQYPQIDLSLCIGCGGCVQACPEEGVLDLAHGQAVVIHGARCVGHGLCAEACPTGGIQVELGKLDTRDDIPVLETTFEVVGEPGLFLAGEVTGYALVRTAITQGVAVARAVAARVREPKRRRARASSSGGVAVAERSLDLLIVGAGPAGLACALAAKEAGIEAHVVEQDSLGGTVAKYPRRKLVMTQPVDLPLHGRLKKSSYLKEELIDLWHEIAVTQELSIETGTRLTGLRPVPGGFEVSTTNGDYRADHVCLCLGRRGTPRKLGVPGEELPKVVYELVDAAAYTNRNILVVGGGDSAIEAALALAKQRGNRITLSYRKSGFTRLKAKNEQRIGQAIASRAVRVIFASEVTEIGTDFVQLVRHTDRRAGRIRNDDVFIFAGGVPPFGLLRDAGVSFDPSLRGPIASGGEAGTGLLPALRFGFVLSVFALTWFWLLRGYYELTAAERPDHRWHDLLRPTSALGLICGALALGLIVTNLAYLIRKSRLGRWIAGSLQNWLSVHMVTGVLALLLLFVHAGMASRLTSGGIAFVSVIILVASGAIGRYLYSWLPKAANGCELELEGARSQLASLRGKWDQVTRPLCGPGSKLGQMLDQLLEETTWETSFLRRLESMLSARWRRRKLLRRLARVAKRERLAHVQIDELVGVARQLHAASVSANNLEGVRGVLASWRFVHLWVAVVMILFAIVHVYTALRFSVIG